MGGIGQLGTLTLNGLKLASQVALTSTMAAVLEPAVIATKRQLGSLSVLENTVVGSVTAMGYGLRQKQGFGVGATAISGVATSDITFKFVAHFANITVVASCVTATDATDGCDMLNLAKCLSFIAESIAVAAKVWALILSDVALSTKRAYLKHLAV